MTFFFIFSDEQRRVKYRNRVSTFEPVAKRSPYIDLSLLPPSLDAGAGLQQQVEEPIVHVVARRLLGATGRVLSLRLIHVRPDASLLL